MAAKLTVLVPDKLRRQAKIAAAVRGETLSDVVRRTLEEYVAEVLGGSERVDDDAAWSRLTAESFLAGYGEEDAVYDELD